MKVLYLFFVFFVVTGVGLSWINHEGLASNFTLVSFVFAVLLTFGYLWGLYAKK